MRASRRQFGMAAGLVVAAMLLGGAQAQAGYVAVGGIGANDDAAWHMPSALAPFAASDACSTTTEPSDAAWQHPDAPSPHDPAAPLAPFGKLPRPACDFGHGGGAGSTSNSGSGPAPSSPPAGDLARPQLPPLQLIHLLPPQTGEGSPFSVASFLFRPPRTA